MLKYIFIFFLFFSSCSKKASSEELKDSLNILFIGNSLTYTNDLPALVKELAKQDGVDITSFSMTLPNYSFEDHWNDGKVQLEIKTGKYDFVIGQQGPSALPASQVLLLDYSTRLADLCKANNTKFSLYTVWPSSDRSFDLDNVILSYKNAATQTGSLLCPAGLAWKYAWQTDAAIPLYSSDGFHPSITGTALAALTIYGALQNKNNFDFIRYDNISWKSNISIDRFAQLKQAALKALGK